MTPPESPECEALCREVEALRQQGSPAQAVQLLQRALQIDPGSFMAGLVLARALLDQARYGEAAAASTAFWCRRSRSRSPSPASFRSPNAGCGPP